MEWHQRLIPSFCQPPPLLLDTEHRKSVDSYGVPSGRVGHGSNGVVMIYKRGNALYAIKRFHLRRRENLREYMKRVNSEFCIASTHTIYQPMDLSSKVSSIYKSMAYSILLSLNGYRHFRYV